MSWYGFRGLFRVRVVGAKSGVSSVEQRVVLVRAKDFDDAIRAGEAEAKRYVKGGRWRNADDEVVTLKYIGACDVYVMDDEPGHGAEIYSHVLVVPHATSDDVLVDRFFGTSPEQARGSRKLEPDFERTLARRVPRRKKTTTGVRVDPSARDAPRPRKRS
jgi:hypothetical protein